MLTRFFLASALPALIAVSGCGNGPATLAPKGAHDAGTDASSDGGVVDAAGDASDGAPGDATGDGADGSGATEGGVVTGVAYVRVAHMGPDSPALDVCFSNAKDPTDFSQSQPFLKPLSATGVAYLGVTAYHQTSAGGFGVRVVQAGASDCSTSLFADVSASLASQEFATLVVAGFASDAGSTPVSLKVLTDDSPLAALVEGGNASVFRVVNDSPGAGLLDLGIGTLADGDYQPLFSTIAYGGVAAPAGMIDANGYLFPVTIDSDTLSAHVDGSATDVATFFSATLNLGELSTLFLAAGGAAPTTSGDGGTTPAAVRGILCADDYAQPATGVLNPSCAELPQ